MSLTELPNQKTTSLDFLSGGGEMGERIRNFDWSKTSLGKPEKWEQGLKTCIRIILTSPQAMFIWWGKDLINIYNDAYGFVLGEKHPQALGAKGKDIWNEIWDEVGFRADIVFNNNEGTYDDALLLIMNRYGYDEETYFKFSYNPIPGDKGGTAGLFCACTEETSRVVNERSLTTLHELDTLAHAKTESDIYLQAATVIASNRKDFPFAVIYEIDHTEKVARPISFAGIQKDQKVFPSFIELDNPEEGSHNFCRAYKTKEIVVSENAGRRKNIPKGAWEKEATHFVHVPIFLAGNEYPVAILSAALNPYRKFDETYKQFAQLIADKIALEISKVKSYEQEKKKAAELAELDRVKTVFFSNISHEFRTPLTLLLGSVEEVLNDPAQPPGNIERMTITHRNAMRLLKLVNTLLDFSRIESGRQKAIYSLTDISSVTKNLAANFRSIVEKGGLKFIVKAETISQPVYVDRQMWEKIIFNLLSNAFKYTLEGSITVKIFAEKNNAVLEVTDTGVGIPKNELPKMFERFHRVENTAGRTYEGTGIGLSFIKELVQLHGGSISVKSKERKGSTFTVKIPFGKDHLPQEQTVETLYDVEEVVSDVYIEEALSLIEKELPTQTSSSEKKGEKILIVDDNADMRNHLISILQKKFSVVSAVNGLDALHKLKNEEPSLILTDIMMPVMDGIQLLKSIKEDPHFAHLPVIFLTARAGEESTIEGYKTGADDYLVKPFSAKELIARINAQLRIRKKREDALQNVYNLFDDVPFAVAVLKGESLIIEFINKYNLGLWQQNKEDVLGKPLFEARPDIKESAERIHQEIYKTGKRFVANEIAVSITNNGIAQTKYFNAIIDPMFDEKGKIIGQLATSLDVTDQVMARKKIEESEEQFRLLANNSPVLIWVNGLKGCEFVNQAYLDFLGVNPVDILNYDWAKFIHPDDRSNYLNAYQDAVSAKEKFEAQFRFLRADGQYRWMKSIALPRISPSGELEGYIGSTTDIHDIILAQEKLTESEERNRLFIEHAPVAMAMFDKEMRYVSVSKKWLQEYDLSGNVIGKSHYELFPNILQRWKEVHARCMQGAIERSEEDFYVKDNGTPVWLNWEVYPWYNAANEIGGIVIFTENITERKKADQSIKENEERLRMAFESVHIGAWEYNPFTQKLVCSSESRKICGIPNDLDPDFSMMMKYIYPADQDYFIECIKNSLSHKGDGNLETLIRFIRYDDQQLRWVKVNGKVFFNNDHLAQKLIGTMTDVTEEKKQQLALKESEEKFRAMANEAPLFVWVTDEKLQTTYLNRTGLEYFDLDESIKMADLSWKKYIHPDDLERVLNIMHDAAAHHESYTLEMRLKNGITGKYRWFLDTGSPRYENDQFVGFIGTSLDIQERKEVEKQLEDKVTERTNEIAGQNVLLQKQNELVKKIFDASVDAIAVYDTETRIITLNQASLDLAGMKAEDIIGKKLLEAIPQMEGSKGHKDLLRAIDGETIHNKIYYSELSGRYLENFLMPLKDENDKVYAVLAMAHDNTELILASDKLKEAQQIAHVGHWDWNVSTGELTWSDNLYNIYGLNAAEGISYQKFISHVHPDDRQFMQETIANALQTGKFNDFFHRIITASGEEKILHARGEVVIDKNGQVSRMVGTGQDVTEQKMIEKELIETSRRIEERNQFIEQLINSSPDLIIVIDKDLRFITMNNKAQMVYKDFYQDDIIGKKVTEVDPPVKGTESLVDLQQAFAGKLIIKEKAKSTISDKYYEHNYVPLTNAAGAVYAVMIISHDITESTKRMEELRRLYESDEQKNNFIAMASHELKTPITSIKGYVQLLLNALEKEKENEKPLPPLLVRSSLISVDKQIKRLTRLISELLDISKIETGTLDLKKEKFSLNELAIETVEDILYTNTRHSINLYHEYQGDIYGDKDRIGQVMINFLTNAIKYSPDSDKIDITVHRISEKEIGFSVKDYGIGIEKSEQKRIFERFYRAKGKEEQTYPGFGIGLFIANEFIEKHGGHVWVESEKGKGSTFTFALPIHNE